MISVRSSECLNQLFMCAVRTHLAISPTDTVDVIPLGANTLAPAPEKQMVVLTIASYLFRLLVIFHIDANRATIEYFCQKDLDRSVTEVFGEVGNLCCGAINRALGQQFLHLGMSTPYVLDSQCAQYLSTLNADFLSRHRIEINGAPMLHATLCLCTYAPLEFTVAPDSDTEMSGSGELELF